MAARQRASCCSRESDPTASSSSPTTRAGKGGELAIHPDAALLFHWIELERQVRIEGTASKVAGAESDAYFASRPRSSRLGAWASPQSRTIPDRAWLEREFAAAAARYEGEHAAVPRPPHLGRLSRRPDHWSNSGRAARSRLHDRIVYRRDGPRWQIERLAP